MLRMKGIKSFHPLAGLVSWIFLVPIGRFGWYAPGKSRLRSLCFVSVTIGSPKIFWITVWNDDSAFPSFRGHSTSSSVVKSALRAFFEAIMQTFCQSLICCSLSVSATANARNLFAVAGPAAGVCGIIGGFILEKRCPHVYTFLPSWSTQGERRDPSVSVHLLTPTLLLLVIFDLLKVHVWVDKCLETCWRSSKTSIFVVWAQRQNTRKCLFFSNKNKLAWRRS